MNASKENAIRAALFIKALAEALPPGMRNHHQRKLDFLAAFVEVARRKLPSEAAYDRAKAKTRPTR